MCVEGRGLPPTRRPLEEDGMEPRAIKGPGSKDLRSGKDAKTEKELEGYVTGRVMQL
jgi:hypothetical protein